MYVDNSNRRVMTYQRPRVAKRTASLPRSHHVLEDILANSSVRKALLWMTCRESDGKCFFMRLCENYDNPQASFSTQLKWTLPNWIIDLALWKAGLDKTTMKKRLFHHRPTVKALALTAKSIGTYGLTLPQRYTAPLFAVWNFTQACNLSCKHCYQSARSKPEPDELTTDEKLNLVDQIGDEYVPFLAFAGGEPLVARDLWKVLDRCAQRGIHVTLATNGTMLTPEICARLKAADVKYIEVSVDSLDAEEHDAFRGMKGAWGRTIQGVKNSVAAGIRTGMACCFTSQTAHTVDDVVRFAIDLGCTTFSHFNFIPVGRGKGIMDQDLTPGQRELLLRKLQRHMEEGKIGVVSTAPQFSRACMIYGSEDGFFATGHAGKGQGKKTMVLSRYIGGCGTGRCYCAIQPNGVFTPCVYIPQEKVGDIRRQTLPEIWNNPVFARLADREDRGDHCGVCDYRYYCGGCRARALSYTGDMQAGDPGCIYNYHQWEELASGSQPRTSKGKELAEKDAGTVHQGADFSQQAGQLVQIMAIASVEAASPSGEVAGVPESDVREVMGLAERLRNDGAGAN